MDNEEKEIQQFDDEKLLSLDGLEITNENEEEILSLDELEITEEEVPDATAKETVETSTDFSDSKITKQQTTPYKNMKARKIVLIIGFVVSFIGFALMAFSLISLLAPNTFATVKIFIPIDIAACATSFVGIVFAVAGANTKKSIAKLSFFFDIMGFVIAAAMLVVMYTTQILPLNLLEF